jgi:heme-degrading monooxygenase HmoA
LTAVDASRPIDARVVTIFRSRVRDEARDRYEKTADRMEQLARSMPGFVEIKTFAADDGERVSLVTFASEETQAAWRRHPEHRLAQEQGREDFYADYSIQVCRLSYERRFSRPVDAG